MSTLNREVIPDYGSHPVAEPCHPILLRAQEDRNCSGLGRKILEASKLRSKPLHDENGLKTFVLVFEKGDEVRERLLEFANTNRFADAHLSAIGAFSEVTLGFFDRQRKNYKRFQSKNKSRCSRSPAILCKRKASRGCMRTCSSARPTARPMVISLKGRCGQHWK